MSTSEHGFSESTVYLDEEIDEQRYGRLPHNTLSFFEDNAVEVEAEIRFTAQNDGDFLIELFEGGKAVSAWSLDKKRREMLRALLVV